MQPEAKNKTKQKQNAASSKQPCQYNPMCQSMERWMIIHVAKGIISSLHETVAKANRYQSSSIPEKWGNRKEHLQNHLFKVVRLMVIVKRVMLIAWY